jgi:hypothetical protein
VTHFECEVIGPRAYRGHDPGTVFEARLERAAARRAVKRGDILILREVQPEIPPGSFTFPHGWLPSHTTQPPRRARLTHGKG